jgi:hypothetical protein
VGTGAPESGRSTAIANPVKFAIQKNDRGHGMALCKGQQLCSCPAIFVTWPSRLLVHAPAANSNRAEEKLGFRGDDFYVHLKMDGPVNTSRLASFRVLTRLSRT